MNLGSHKLTPAQREDVVFRYLNGENGGNVAREYGVDRTNVYTLLRARGISKRFNVRPTYDFDRRYFAVLDTETKAYWAGFLLADGGVNSLGAIALRLGEKDRTHLEAFAAAIGGGHPITDCQAEDGRTLVTVRLHSREMMRDLAVYGIIPRKTFGHPCPTGIPAKGIRHFLRGYFDGDGCITEKSQRDCSVLQYALAVCGGRQFLEWFREQARVGVPTLAGNLREMRGTWLLTIGGNRQAGALARWLYEGATVSLERKATKANRAMAPGRVRTL